MVKLITTEEWECLLDLPINEKLVKKLIKKEENKLEIEDFIQPVKKTYYKLKGIKPLYKIKERIEHYVKESIKLKGEEIEVNGYKITGVEGNIIYEMDMLNKNEIERLLKEKETYKTRGSIFLDKETFPLYVKYKLLLSIKSYLLNRVMKGVLIIISRGYTNDNIYELDIPLYSNQETKKYLDKYLEKLKSEYPDDCTKIERGYKPSEMKLLRLSKRGNWVTVKGSKTKDKDEFEQIISHLYHPNDKIIYSDADYVLCKLCQFNHICSQSN